MLPVRFRLLALALLPLPIWQLSIAIPKLASIYNDPRFERPLLVALILGAASLALGASRLVRGPEAPRRAAWLAAILGAAGLLAWNIFRTNPVRIGAMREVIHIGEYGALGGLALGLLSSHLRGRSGYVVTLAYAGSVGVLDELVQFYHPLRVGDMRDVATNVLSSLLGIALASQVAGHVLEQRPDRATRRSAFMAAGAFLGTLLVFHGIAESGYLVSDAARGTFRSRLPVATLRARAAENDVQRCRRIQTRDDHHPIYALEDFYLSEARAHITTRDGAKRDAALCENAILETYYAPALRAQRRNPQDAGTGAEWSATRVAAEQAKAGASFESFAASYASPCFQDLDTRHEPAFYALLGALPLVLGVGIALTLVR